jgi:hypothetical protein
MSLTGGKRKVNPSLKAWVAFVKKVQKEEKCNYKDAIHKAKIRKDKGEKWMHGGSETMGESSSPLLEDGVTTPGPIEEMDTSSMPSEPMMGGKRSRTMTRRRSARKTRSARRTRSAGKGKSRASRRH